jgi:hypothetical protein
MTNCNSYLSSSNFFEIQQLYTERNVVQIMFLNEIINLLKFSSCCLIISMLSGLFFWSSWKVVKAGISQLRRLHQIPCSKCVFFTGDYRLKCTVHPSKALSEDALNCLDFEPMTCRYPCCTKKLSHHSKLLKPSGNITAKKIRFLSR